MKRVVMLLSLLAVAIPLAGCVVTTYPARPGWCYWHPYRCR